MNYDTWVSAQRPPACHACGQEVPLLERVEDAEGIRHQRCPRPVEGRAGAA